MPQKYHWGSITLVRNGPSCIDLGCNALKSDGTRDAEREYWIQRKTHMQTIYQSTFLCIACMKAFLGRFIGTQLGED